MAGGDEDHIPAASGSPDASLTQDDSFTATSHAGLTYPWGEAAPGAGETIRIADGISWARIPMPGSLGHINSWLLDDHDGIAVVDTGICLTMCSDAWKALYAGALKDRRITRVIGTHLHPDHIGLAGWLCGRFAAPLAMSRLEYVTARMLISDTGQQAPEEGAAFYCAAGWDADQIEAYRKGYGQFGKWVSPMPAGYSRMREGDRLSIGGRDWRVVVGEGHSPEHACLWRESDGIVLGGDQILPKISSNVSVWPTEPDADPLGEWLESLQRMKTVFPDDVLVLPSHGEPFRGVQARLGALIRGHRAALKRLQRALRTPSRTVDVFAALFARPVGDGVRGMATGESLAHLNYLLRRGRVSRSRDADGVDWWTAMEQGPRA